MNLYRGNGVKVSPATRVGGSFTVPGDKSISHRSIMLGSLSSVPCEISNFLTGEDCLSTLNAFRAMGIHAEQNGTNVRIEGKGLRGLTLPKSTLDCGNSGTTTRLMLGILTGCPFEARLVGDDSLSRRPMDRVLKPLTQMGAEFNVERPANDPLTFSHLPLRIRGAARVKPLKWDSPVASAQVKSAILLAGLFADGITEFSEPSLSRDHSERMLAGCGVKLVRSGPSVKLYGPAEIRASRFDVPGDISSAAFFLAAGVLRAANGLTVKGVGLNPTRTGFLDILKAMGARIEIANTREVGGETLGDVTVYASKLTATRIAGPLVPRAIDEFPSLALLATQAEGTTIIADAHELRVKESDRITAVAQAFNQMGARITEKEDGMVVEGPTPLHAMSLTSHGDHRLAMSVAIAALVAQGETTVEDVDCVNTSFPNFWTLLQAARG